QRPEEGWALVEENEPKVLKPVYFLPFDVQLQNTFCIEIMARRFPVDIENVPHVQVNLEEAQVDIQASRAQVTLHVRTVSNDNPPPFDISFKLLGIFNYSEHYRENEVRVFLEQGSLSILLPFARELLFSICARLQVPPMMLTMVQLVPHPSIHKSSHEENLNNE
ncbi:MAG TPA: protein-export chaperone SecB, partial [Ktedonobacteraceae bacterium]|nr:protein-export chaperone SecB [Ktedonobacteraceae bacterium]